MSELAAGKELFLAPECCRISKTQRTIHAYGSNYYENIEELPKSLVLDADAAEAYRVVLRKEDGTFRFLSPKSYTCSISSGGNVRLKAAPRGFILKSERPFTLPEVLTITCSDQPELNLNISVIAEAPRKLYLFGRWYCLDLRRRHLLVQDSSSAGGCNYGFSADKWGDLQYYGTVKLLAGESQKIYVLAEYSDGCYRWLNDSAVELSASEAIGTDSWPGDCLDPAEAGYFEVTVPDSGATRITVTLKSLCDKTVWSSFNIEVMKDSKYNLYDNITGLDGEQQRAEQKMLEWIEDGTKALPLKYLSCCQGQPAAPIKHERGFYGFAIATMAETDAFLKYAEKLTDLLRNPAADDADYLRKVRSVYYQLISLRHDMMRHYCFEYEQNNEDYAIGLRMIVHAYSRIIMGFTESPSVSLEELEKCRYAVWPHLAPKSFKFE